MSELYSQPFVFLSYAHADEVFVMRLKADLEAHGIPIWIDREGILPGTPNWDRAIRIAIRTADAVLLVASPHARSSRVVHDELAVARMYQCPVYPLWIAGTHWIDVIPLGMGRIQYIDAREPLYERAINEMIAALKSALSAHRTKASDPHDQESSQTASPHSVLQVGRRQQHPLIGREHEMEVLRGLLLKTEERGHLPQTEHTAALDLFPNTPSRSPCLVLLGEAGIGKTRLAEEINREAQRRRWAVVWSRCYAQENSIPYRPWTEVVRQVMTQGIVPQSEVSLYPLRYQPITTLFSEFAALLPQNVVLPALTPAQGQYRLWEAMLALLIAISKDMPLLLILDDLHWTDGSSAELLTFLVRRLQRHPVLLLGSCRKSEIPVNHSLHILLKHLLRERLLVTLPIPPLSDEQIGALVTHVPTPEAKLIQSQAAGNPFIAEELAHVASFVGSSTLAMPETISALLDLRLGILSSACQRLLSNAAVLGGSFTFQAIHQMEVDTSMDRNEDSILDLLDEAIQAGVITEEGTGTRIYYYFWHPLLVSHLYDQLSAARRARLHRRAAEALRRVYEGREEEGTAVITNHLVAGGGEPLQIVNYAELAGDRAYNLSAYFEAEGFYRIAVSQLDEHIGPSLRNSSQEERSRLAYFLERLGECMRVQGNDVEARRLYERVLEVRSYQRTYATDDEFKFEAQIDALLWREIALTWYDLWDSEQAQKCCERGEQVLREAGVVGGAAWAMLRFQQGYIDWGEGNYNSAYGFALEALEFFKGLFKQQNLQEGGALRLTGTRRTLAGDPVNLGRTQILLAAIVVSIGKPTEALVYLDTSLALFEQYDRQREIANVCCNIGDIHLRKAEHQKAQASFRRSLDLADHVGDRPLKAVVFGNLGVLAFRSGSLSEAEEWFKKGITLAEQINDQGYISLFCACLATVFQDQGKLSESRDSVYRALTIGRAFRNTPCISLSLVALGSLRVVQAVEHTIGHNRDQKDSKGLLTVRQDLEVADIHFLLRAKATLERVLVLQKELEAETKIEARLVLAKVYLLLGNLDKAWQQVTSTFEEACQYELIWEPARAQNLMGSIMAAQGQLEQAVQYFEQAMLVFRKCGMRLECARTLHNYGATLLEYESTEQESYHQGLSYLQEARQVFDACRAALDLQRIERDISIYKDRRG